MDDRIINAINAIYFIAYLVGLSIAFISIGVRLIRYRRAHRPVPALLPRDLFLLFGLLLPLVGTLALRVWNINPRSAPWWIVLSGALAVASIWVFVYYELRVIERPPR